MKYFSVLSLCVILFAAATLCKSQHPAFAQVNNASANQWRQIHLRNVRADIMAYFIDPKHQKQPIEFKVLTMAYPSHASQEQGEMDAMKAGAPKLNFDGVLAVDDKQSTLWILSSNEMFDQTKNFVDFMDHPIAQCELEAQVVKVSSDDLKTLVTQPLLGNSSYDLPYKFNILPINPHGLGQLQVLLSQLIKQGKAKIINSPRLTTLNHLMGSIASATTIPVFLGIKGENNSYDPLIVDANNDYPVGISKQLRFAFTPEINEAANTMMINLDVSADEGISRYNAYPEETSTFHNQTIWVHNQLDPPLVAKINVTDNQAIEITGLDSTMLGYDEKHDNVVIFLTARILHREQG